MVIYKCNKFTCVKIAISKFGVALHLDDISKYISNLYCSSIFEDILQFLFVQDYQFDIFKKKNFAYTLIDRPISSVF